jgi:integrase
VETAGLADVTPHVLRHSAACFLAESGVSMSEIAQILGHSDSRLTERVYARYGPEYLRKAMKALEWPDDPSPANRNISPTMKATSGDPGDD